MSVDILFSRALQNGTEAPTMPQKALAHCVANPDDFPCDLNNISLVSLGIAGGGVALLFVIYLYLQVRCFLAVETRTPCVFDVSP